MAAIPRGWRPAVWPTFGEGFGLSLTPYHAQTQHYRSTKTKRAQGAPSHSLLGFAGNATRPVSAACEIEIGALSPTQPCKFVRRPACQGGFSLSIPHTCLRLRFTGADGMTEALPFAAIHESGGGTPGSPPAAEGRSLTPSKRTWVSHQSPSR